MAAEPSQPGADDPADKPPSRAGRNLPLAIVTGLSLAGLIIATLFISDFAFFVLLVTAVLIAQAELYRAMAARGMRPASFLGVAAGGVILSSAYAFGADGRGTSAMSFTLVATVVATLLWFLVDEHREGMAVGVAATLFGVIYVPFMASHVVLMSRLERGAWITIVYIGLTAFYDIGAYAAGSLFGRHPIAPAVSPKKSWEGAIGATLVVAVLALLVVPLFDPFTAADAALLALVTAVVAPLGDLTESLIKRDLKIKDMGSILPGHGGLLDRIDALLLVAPAAYWTIRGVVL